MSQRWSAIFCATGAWGGKPIGRVRVKIPIAGNRKVEVKMSCFLRAFDFLRIFLALVFFRIFLVLNCIISWANPIIGAYKVRNRPWWKCEWFFPNPKSVIQSLRGFPKSTQNGKCTKWLTPVPNRQLWSLKFGPRDNTLDIPKNFHQKFQVFEWNS